MSNILGGQYLVHLAQEDPRLAALFQRVIGAINSTAKASGVSPVGQMAAPTAPNGITVKASGEMVHIAINDGAATSRPNEYFTEYSNNEQFSAPWVIHHGASRNHTMTLPTKDDSGTPHNWYFRTFKQAIGGPPSEPVTYGGSAQPTAVTLSGTTQLTLPTSNGSGTASNTGAQGAQGYGKQPTRPAIGPKSQKGI